MFAYQTKSEDIGDQGVMSGLSGAEYNMTLFGYVASAAINISQLFMH